MVTALVRREPVAGALTALTCLTLAASAAQAGCAWMQARAGEGVARGLRARVAHHTLRLPLADVRAALESGLVHVPAAAFGVLAVLTAMTCLDPQLALVTVGTFLLVDVPAPGRSLRTRRAR
ncbi:hypothetical protein ADK65_17640 [Streptomyces sp. NRRL B-1140]|nr:hypothetical protein ADK65_17640 [Streptomyces sp. NRRL B-1140]